MDWLKQRLREPSSYVGVIMFLVGIVGQFVPAIKEAITPDVATALGTALAAIGGILFGKPAPAA